MTSLLEIKERLKNFWGKYELYLFPAVTSVLTFLTFLMINHHIEYMSKVTGMTLTLVLALICVLLPVNMILLLAMVLVLLNLYALTPAACIVALLIFTVMYLLYFLQLKLELLQLFFQQQVLLPFLYQNIHSYLLIVLVCRVYRLL